MNSGWIFPLTVAAIAVAINLESWMLWMEWRHKALSRFFGSKARAFKIHAAITSTTWSLAGCGVVLTLLLLPSDWLGILWLQIVGWFFSISGMAIATLGFKELGIRRSLAVNFFEGDQILIRKGIYRLLRDPEDVGLWIMMYGLAFGADSWEILVYACLFLIFMIPHEKIEALPLKSA